MRICTECLHRPVCNTRSNALPLCAICKDNRWKAAGRRRAELRRLIAVGGCPADVKHEARRRMKEIEDAEDGARAERLLAMFDEQRRHGRFRGDYHATTVV